MPVFALQVLITNILFSWIILTAFMKLDRENMHSLPELMIYSLGFGPIGTSLLLYYLLLIVPHQSDLFYVLAVIVVYLFLFLLGRKNWSRALAEIVTMATKIKANYKTLNQLARMESIAVTGILLIALSIFFYVYFGYTLRLPLDESDALKYGEMGKICYQEKSLDYRWVRNDPETGFAPDFNSAPSFALLLTWEKMTGALFSSYQDIYFKSIGAYYALLILGILIFWLSKRNKLLAFLGVFAYLSGLYFFATLFEQHLDSYRIFFVIISWIWLAYAIDKNDRFSFVFFGISSGLAAYAHTSGAFLALINGAIYTLFIKGSCKYKLKKLASYIALIISFGLIHYLLDVFWGTGWLFFRRAVTYWG